jgi:glyoxylase-like metal-dependent hydrolase (beta-lactamase superfamily II)
MFFWLIEKIKPIPAVKVDLALAEGEVIPATGGYIVVHAPGHTPGSMCLYHAERRILISSDALFNMNPFTGKKGLIVPPGLVTADLPQALDSVRKLAGLEVEVLLCGHGDPILEKAGERIKKLAS